MYLGSESEISKTKSGKEFLLEIDKNKEKISLDVFNLFLSQKDRKIVGISSEINEYFKSNFLGNDKYFFIKTEENNYYFSKT